MNIFRPKPPWPNPGDSVCADTRWECPGSSKIYWSARGPASQAFITVKDKIRQHLEDVEHQLYEGLEEASIPHAISYFMVGSSAATARPYVVISCQNERFARKAMEAIKTTTWWRDFMTENLGFGGFRLLRYAPRRIADMQKVTRNGWVYSSNQSDSLVGAPIFFTDDRLELGDTCKPPQATLGEIIYLEDIPFGLTVAHPLCEERVEENLEYDMQYNTNEYYADDSDDESSVTSTSTSTSSSALAPESLKSIASSQYQSLPELPRLVGRFIGRSSGTAQDPFDWALIAFSGAALKSLMSVITGQSPTNAVQSRLSFSRKAPWFDDTKSMALDDVRGNSSETKIDANESFVCLAGSRRYLSLHSVLTKTSLRVGDCGTWILDHTGGW